MYEKLIKIKEFKEDIHMSNNHSRYIIIDNIKWYHSGDILRYLNKSNTLSSINDLKCDKMVVKYRGEYIILLSDTYTNKEPENTSSSIQHVPHISQPKHLNIKYLKRRPSKLYVFLMQDNTIKIGVSSNTYKRKNQIQCQSGKKVIKEYHTKFCYNAYDLEKEIKTYFSEYNLFGEWFGDVSYKEVCEYLKELFKDKAKIK